MKITDENFYLVNLYYRDMKSDYLFYRMEEIDKLIGRKESILSIVEIVSKSNSTFDPYDDFVTINNNGQLESYSLYTLNEFLGETDFPEWIEEHEEEFVHH